MGNCTNIKGIDEYTFETISNTNFEYKQIIGRGGFGRV
jgi:hypothetical protein